MKKKIVILLATIFILTMPILSAKTITATLDGQEIVFDQAPIIENDRTIVPVRAIMEALGLTVDYNNNTSTATGVKEGFEVVFTAGNSVAYINGEAKTLEVPAKLIGNRMFIPLRFLSEEMGIGVTWDPNNRKIILDSSGKSTIIDKIVETNPDLDDLKGEYYLHFPNVKNFLYNSGIDTDRYLTVTSNTKKMLQYILIVDGENGDAIDLANAALGRYDLFVNSLFNKGLVVDYSYVDDQNYFSETITLSNCIITTKIAYIPIDQGGGGQFDFMVKTK